MLTDATYSHASCLRLYLTSYRYCDLCTESAKIDEAICVLSGYRVLLCLDIPCMILQLGTG
ncbi:hypothetical protein M433DRAFT_160116 [Acidomyces richmondensis BFW]|nr:hypothetical protein M433DRAFT_160116 [Acidomyces richmondensis BFW]